MKYLLFLLFAGISMTAISQQDLHAIFSKTTDFHKVTGNNVIVSFDLNADLTTEQLANTKEWAAGNATILTVDVEGRHIVVTVSAENNNQHIWMKLFMMMGVVNFEVPTSSGMKLMNENQLFQHYDI